MFENNKARIKKAQKHLIKLSRIPSTLLSQNHREDIKAINSSLTLEGLMKISRIKQNEFKEKSAIRTASSKAVGER